jgi:hypothetical protein
MDYIRTNENFDAEGELSDTGFYNHKNKSFFDPHGVYFDENGLDELGGTYNINGIYVPPEAVAEEKTFEQIHGNLNPEEEEQEAELELEEEKKEGEFLEEEVPVEEEEGEWKEKIEIDEEIEAEKEFEQKFKQVVKIEEEKKETENKFEVTEKEDHEDFILSTFTAKK